MAEFNPNNLTKEQLAKASKCKTAEELIALAKATAVITSADL
jgi:hypothetical protein